MVYIVCFILILLICYTEYKSYIGYKKDWIQVTKEMLPNLKINQRILFHNGREWAVKKLKTNDLLNGYFYNKDSVNMYHFINLRELQCDTIFVQIN